MTPLPNPSLDIEAIREAAEKATPGPWFQSGAPWFVSATAVLAGSPDPHVGPMIADTEQWDGWRSEQALDAAFLVDPEDDAAFIAAANPQAVLSLIARTEAAEAEVERLTTLTTRLQAEAESHAGEARAHKSSLHEAYQAVTGATGEPGNWNGAKPIRAYVAAAEAREAELIARCDALVEITEEMVERATRAFCVGIGKDPDKLCNWSATITNLEHEREPIRLALTAALTTITTGGGVDV